MRFFHLTISFTLLFSSIQAAPVSTLVHTKRATPPTGWTQLQRADATSFIPLRLSLAQSNIENLYSMLLSVSDPALPTYGQFWTPQQVAVTFAPNTSTIASVTGWLQNSGISIERIQLSNGLQWVSLNASVAEAEQLLSTQLYVYEHTSGIVQVGQYHLIDFEKYKFLDNNFLQDSLPILYLDKLPVLLVSLSLPYLFPDCSRRSCRQALHIR